MTASTTAGLQVVNYLSYDSRGQAPSIAMDISAADINTGTSGIQVVEGTTIPIAVNVADDLQVRNVELLVNGQVVINDVSFPWDLSTIAPNIRDNRDTVTLQLRATDTGGNEALSVPVQVQLVPDTIAPIVVGTTPEDGGVRGMSQRTVEVRFSEPMDATTLSDESVVVRDTLGNVLAPEQFAVRATDRMVHLTYGSLAQGNYEIVISGATDRAGNVFGTGEVLVSQFEIVHRVAIWTGPTSGSWTDPNNWFEGHVPEPSDVVVINSPGDYQVSLTGNATIDSLRVGAASGTQSLIVSGALTLVGDGEVRSGGLLRFNNGSLSGDGTLTVENGGSFVLNGGAVSNDLILKGELTVYGASSIEGAFISDVGSTVAIQAISGLSATLTSESGFTNAGSVTLESTHGSYTTSLVTNGTLINAAGGDITVNAANGGGRIINADLINQGTVNLNYGTSLPKSVTNEGTFNVASGVTLGIAGVGHTFQQKGGSLGISGEMQFTASAVLDYDGGTITGTPLLRDSTLDAAPGVNAISATFWGNSTLQGDVPQGSSALVQAISGLSATLTSANGFTNAGTMALESTHGSYTSSLVVTNGTLTNAPAGEINVNVAGGGGRVINGAILNQGTVNVDYGASFLRPIANQGSFNMAANTTLAPLFNTGTVSIGADAVASLSGSGATMRQAAGSITIDGSLRLSAGAVLDYDGGTITGTSILRDSTLDAASGVGPLAVTFWGNSTLQGDVPQGSNVLIQAISGVNATLTSENGFSNAGMVALESTNNSYTSSLVVTNGTLTNALTGEINVNRATGGGRVINAEILNQGTVNLNYGTSLPKSVTNEGTFNVATGVTLGIAGAGHTFRQKAGSLAISGGMQFTTGAVLDYDGGTITGTPLLRDSTLDAAPGVNAVSATLWGNSTLKEICRRDPASWSRQSAG